MRSNRRDLDPLRRLSTPVESALIDEWLAGRMGRRDFLRHGTVLGMSIPLLGAFTGGAASVTASGNSVRQAGGTIRVGMSVPAGAIDPLTVADTGGVCMLTQTAE